MKNESEDLEKERSGEKKRYVASLLIHPHIRHARRTAQRRNGPLHAGEKSVCVVAMAKLCIIYYYTEARFAKDRSDNEDPEYIK